MARSRAAQTKWFAELAKLREQGLIRHLGVSNIDAALPGASPVLLPIPGTGSLAHLVENVGAASVRLTPEDLAGLAG